MNSSQKQLALKCAIATARAAGKLMRANLNEEKKINSRSAHDIKLDLDVRTQRLIHDALHRRFPQIGFLGEEGDSGELQGEYRWVVDPIDGTVNFTYGIPHACVSIALQQRVDKIPSGMADPYQSIVGLVYDPFCDEMWTAVRGEPTRLNGKLTHVSDRSSLRECIISIGFGKLARNMDEGLPYFGRLIRRVRKVRMMGAAALGLAYVASGRFDAYIERGVRIWDIAAGSLLIECAGGEFWSQPVSGRQTYRMIANNGRLRKKLTALEA